MLSTTLNIDLSMTPSARSRCLDPEPSIYSDAAEPSDEHELILLARELIATGRDDEACELSKNSCIDDPEHTYQYQTELARIGSWEGLLQMFENTTVKAQPMASAEQWSYRYQSYVSHVPMADSTKGIRLLSLPFRDGEHISCNLFDFDDMIECPSYFALSYTWGDPKAPLRDIELNGQPFKVRQNLFDFLQRFDSTCDAWIEDFETLSIDSGSSRRLAAFAEDMKSKKRKFLWIDALCIDQSSNIEKTNQVRRMNEIFGRAEFVVVWLPSGSPVSKVKGGNIAETGVQAASVATRRAIPTQGWWKKKHYAGPTKLGKILADPYWSRLWIVQEFALARELILWCGDRPMLWSDLRESAMSQHKKLPKPRTFHALNELRGEGFIDYRTADKDLPELIRKFWASSCEDARDRVFALIGLAGKGALIDVEYEVDAEELLILMATAYETYYRSDLKFYELASNLRLDDETALLSFVSLHGFEAFKSPALREMAMSMGIVQ